MALYDFRQDGSKLQLYKKGSNLLCHEFDFGGGTTTDKDEQTLSLNGNDLTISNGNTITLPSETITSLIANGTQYDYTAEDGNIYFVVPATFISNDVGNAISIGTDNGLMISIPAQLPDDQLLSGDNSGTINITLTPDPQPDGSINYLVKADLPIALATPNGNNNALKLDASDKWYVEPETVTGFTNLLTTGTQIGTYTKEDGTTQDIYAPSGGGGGSLSTGAMSFSERVVGTTSTAATGSAAGIVAIPGVTSTFTTTTITNIIIPTAVAMYSSSVSSTSAQGVTYLEIIKPGNVVEILDVKYWSVANGNSLVNLPVASVMSGSLSSAPAGTYTVRLRFKVWSGSVIANYVPTIYAGYVAGTDSNSMKSSLVVMTVNI